jgi:hypothetical protein
VLLHSASEPLPVLSDIRVTAASGGVLVSWRLNRDADGIVNWGPTKRYGNHRSDFSFTRGHAIPIVVDPGEYYLAIRSCLREPAGVCIEVTGLRFAVASPDDRRLSRDQDLSPGPLEELTVEEFELLREVVANALISVCDPDSYYCVTFAATTGEGPIIQRSSRVTVRYSGWVVPDFSQVDSDYLRDFDTTSTPVQNRKLAFVMGESDLQGLEMALAPQGAEALREGAVVWIVMPPQIAGSLNDGLPPVPTDGGVAVKVEIRRVVSATE